MSPKTKYLSLAALILCAGFGLVYAFNKTHKEKPPAQAIRVPAKEQPGQASGPRSISLSEPALLPPTSPTASSPGVAPRPADSLPLANSAAGAVPAAAPAALSGGQSWKIGVVDMNRVLMAYHKTREMERKLNQDKSQAKKEFDTRSSAYQSIADQLSVIDKIMKDKLVNEQLKMQKRIEGQALMEQANGLIRNIQEFKERRERQLQDVSLRMRKVLVAAVVEQVQETAKRNNYDLVFDKSGLSFSGNQMIPISRDSFDFSAEVIEALNRNAPAEPATAAQPAP